MKENKVREILISGYGPGEKNQPSIALYEIDDQLNICRQLWSDIVKAPSFLCTYHDLCFVLCEEKGEGALLCYQRKEEEYILRDTCKLTGGELCHIVYNPEKSVLYCSFYETGHIGAVKVKDYHFTEILNFFQISPKAMGGLTRAHCATLEPDGERVFVTNIALDRIYIYQSKEGALLPDANIPFYDMKEGVGPRHLKFHPLLNYLYVITEYSNEIYTYLYEKKDGIPSLKCLQVISTLPEGFKGTSYGSSIDISKDGRFLYAANRGSDTIAVYDVNPCGILNKIQDVSCQGNHPRHIALTKDDTGLMIANQNSNEVVIIKVDENTGKLLDILVRKPFYAPSFVKEL